MSQKNQNQNQNLLTPSVQFSSISPSRQTSYVDLKAIKKRFFVSKIKSNADKVEVEKENFLLDQIDVQPNTNNYRDLKSVNYKATKARPTLKELQVIVFLNCTH
jgi:hypothetical protein